MAFGRSAACDFRRKWHSFLVAPESASSPIAGAKTIWEGFDIYLREPFSLRYETSANSHARDD